MARHGIPFVSFLGFCSFLGLAAFAFVFVFCSFFFVFVFVGVALAESENSSPSEPSSSSSSSLPVLTFLTALFGLGDAGGSCRLLFVPSSGSSAAGPVD
jgi:hypothetical protein